jgi:plastocyanin domain-containing protein
MHALTVNIAGLSAIVLIIWWFWLSRPTARLLDSVITVVVEDGVYSPARIQVAAGHPTVLRFLRKDPSPCAAKVIFSGLNVSVDLPIGQERELRIEPQPPGEYEFTCEMNMYRGSLLVK